jgi:hypothetical protein
MIYTWGKVMSEWTSIVNTLGVAAGILGFMGLCLWKSAPWVADKVILPTVERWLKLIDALIISVIKQAETMEKIGIAMSRLCEAVEKSACRANEIIDKEDRIGRTNREERQCGEDMGR